MARKFKVVVNGKEYLVEVEEIKEVSNVGVSTATMGVEVSRIERVESPKVGVSKVEAPKPVEKSSGGGKLVKAPMAGVVVKILVKEGQNVSVGDKLLIFEAMKMENELVSEHSGVVKEIAVKEGDHVETGQVLMVIE